jgi:excisionase family DNA binding protein
VITHGHRTLTVYAAKILGVGRPKAQWLVERGTLKAFTMLGGKKRFVSRADVERLKDGSWRRYKPRGE